MPAVASRQKLFFPFAAVAPIAGAPALTVESLQANPVVPGVSAIAEGPAKGHSAFDDVNAQMVPVYVDAETVRTVMAAAQLYAGGLRVNAGHFTEITEAAGRLTAFRVDGPKLRADFNLFRTYSQFAHLCELIVTIPDTFGLSIDFDGTAEFSDGKAYPRVTEIYSCDLVPTPAANGGGLFGADLPPHIVAHLRRLFDTSEPPIMPPAAPAAPATPPAAPATPAPVTPPAEPAAPDMATQVKDAVTAAIGPALETAIAPLRTELSGLTQRITALEADAQADAATDAALPETTPMPAMSRLRRRVIALERGTGAQAAKLARRFGLEFAARAGANPLDNPASTSPTDPSGDTRKAFEIPTSEHNLAALRSLNLGK